MPEIDYEAEYHRLNAALDRLENAALRDSARWELERDALYKNIVMLKIATLNEENEIAELSALLRDIYDATSVCDTGPALRERIQDALNRV